MGDQNACIQSIDINKYVYINLVKVVLFKNHESDYQLNMNVVRICAFQYFILCDYSELFTRT